MAQESVDIAHRGDHATLLRDLLRRLSAGQHLSRAEASAMTGALLSPEITDALIAAVLVALAAKGERAEELSGVADALAARMVRVHSAEPTLDTAGTGASAAKTFNISTAAAFVIAGAGHAVAKHGNRAASSKSGSADVLQALGVALSQPDGGNAAHAEHALDQLGICFLFAPLYHPALARVAPVRRELGMRTTFNLAGPLVNPCLAPYRVMGVSARPHMRAVAEALASLGIVRAWVVRGHDGLDEVTLSGPTTVFEVEDGKVREKEVTPEDFGISRRDAAGPLGSGPEENAIIIRAVLEGERRDTARDLVLLNAAAAIHVRTGDALEECTARAAESIDSGRAMRKLEALREISAEGAGA